jgi:hypothetical protein
VKLTRIGPSTARAAWWTLGAARQAHRQLDHAGLDGLSLAAAPSVPASAALGVRVVLRLRRERCLVRSAVFQAWHLGQGTRYDLVIGVTAPRDDFTAHAWLDGDPSACRFTEIARRGAGRERREPGAIVT